MFDFTIFIGDKSKFIDLLIPSHHNSNKYLVRRYETQNSVIMGYSYIHEDDCFEDENLICITIGSVYRRITDSANLNIVKPSELCLYAFKDFNILSELKGNFCLIFIDKISDRIKVINDHFAVRPVYYGSINGNYIISNNLNYFKRYNFKVNYSSVLEQLIFTYPISDDTLLSGVSYLNGGDVLSCVEKKLTLSNDFCIIDYMKNLNDLMFNKFDFIDLFNKSVLQRANTFKKNVVSFTAGFDGRAIISALLANNVDFLSYSFGIKDGVNTSIPNFISGQIGFEYYPIYLDDDYILNYGLYADSIIFDSDGASYNERANYGYAFNKLSNFSNTVITGLIGGEVLRPVHLKTDYMNQHYFDTVYMGKNYKLSEALINNSIDEFINNDIISYYDEVKDNAYNRYKILEDFRGCDKGYMFYLLDLLQLGFRRYYGTEIHYERYYAENVTPIFDFDIINYLFNSDYSKIYTNAFKKSKIYRWKGQKIYSEIIMKNKPELTTYPTDRGYPPSYLLNNFKLMFIPVKHSIRRREIKRNIFPDFNEKEWCSEFIKVNRDFQSTEIFSFNAEKVSEFCSSYKPNLYNKDFNRLLSLSRWLIE